MNSPNDTPCTTGTKQRHASRASAPLGTRRTYAKRGTKTKAREAAIRAGSKTFAWFCQRGHGLTVFGTSGKGQCRMCVALHQVTKAATGPNER